MDLRSYARGTGLRLALGGLALLFGVGGLLIYLFYGPGGAALGLACLLVGLLPILLVLLVLTVLDRLVRRSDDD
jgi:hypothetical protein